ncbi:ribosome maturation factor RimP [Leptolyngbya sp. PCC 6406]|uniref:ribosome maturation factor RimP n=1 Tax=Leptolyngbya sp. PCC 6406 TaxID=1173264 RepID=UPI0002ABC859|nr:ribosome maturation factor RimP [Leptolyngbya sp. PCC 6406]
MAHPLIPQVLDLASPVAQELGLEVVGAVFQTNQSPPVLRLDVRNCHQEDTGLDDCERMSQALADVLETHALIPDAYVLEISSPGVSPILETDRDFVVFKGFMVEVELSEPYKDRRTWLGQLIRRDPEQIYLNLKGRSLKLPRALVATVQLSDQSPDA